MRSSRILIALSLSAAAVSLGGCVGDGGYGYGGIGYDVAWGDPYWGWYGDYYYPGTGIYVYDANRRRHAWTPEQQRYWQGRRTGWRGAPTTVRNNWRDFRTGAGRAGGPPPRGGRPHR